MHARARAVLGRWQRTYTGARVCRRHRVHSRARHCDACERPATIQAKLVRDVDVDVEPLRRVHRRRRRSHEVQSQRVVRAKQLLGRLRVSRPALLLRSQLQQLVHLAGAAFNLAPQRRRQLRSRRTERCHQVCLRVAQALTRDEGEPAPCEALCVRRLQLQRSCAVTNHCSAHIATHAEHMHTATHTDHKSKARRGHEHSPSS